jgi:hypothetical protein
MDITNLPKKTSGKYTTTFELTHAYVAKNEANVIDHILKREKYNIKVIYPTEEELAPVTAVLANSVRTYIADEANDLIKHKRGIYD